MKLFFIFLNLMISTICFSGVAVNPNCYNNGSENIMYMDMFPWNQTQKEMSDNFKRIYVSGKRMENRVFYDGKQFLMPFKSYLEGVKYAVVPLNFINSLVSHIESALEKSYVDHINFSDMGHNHLFIPRDFYNKELSSISMVKEKNLLYQKLMNHEDLLMLYHTAEQLKFFDENKELQKDRYTQKRFYTRNIIGKNRPSKNLDLLFDLKASANGVSNFKQEDYKYWGAGFSFSSTKNGCFSYKKGNEIFFFDISPEDIGYNSTNYDDDYM